jgi:hypothetical protein
VAAKSQPDDSGESDKAGQEEAENEVEERWQLSNETLTRLAMLITAIAAPIGAAHGSGGPT